MSCNWFNDCVSNSTDYNMIISYNWTVLILQGFTSTVWTKILIIKLVYNSYSYSVINLLIFQASDKEYLRTCMRFNDFPPNLSPLRARKFGIFRGDFSKFGYINSLHILTHPLTNWKWQKSKNQFGIFLCIYHDLTSTY